MENKKNKDSKLEPETKLMEVYSVWGPAEAEVIKVSWRAMGSNVS